MVTKASAQKRQANRRNALRSTGPKSPAGKRRSSTNARMHGLSVIAQIGISDPILTQLTRMIAEDGIDNFGAQEIASRIVSYERNQAYQRTLFSQLQQPSRTETAVHEEMRNSFGKELDLIADFLDEQRYLVGRIKKSDFNFVINMQHKMLKLTLKQIKRQEAEHAKRVRNSVRYLKRSSNQLIKSLKSLQSE
jgi:protein-arginine kinase activator protein McsA